MPVRCALARPRSRDRAPCPPRLIGAQLVELGVDAVADQRRRRAAWRAARRRACLDDVGRARRAGLELVAERREQRRLRTSARRPRAPGSGAQRAARGPTRSRGVAVPSVDAPERCGRGPARRRAPRAARPRSQRAERELLDRVQAVAGSASRSAQRRAGSTAAAGARPSACAVWSRMASSVPARPPSAWFSTQLEVAPRQRVEDQRARRPASCEAVTWARSRFCVSRT